MLWNIRNMIQASRIGSLGMQAGRSASKGPWSYSRFGDSVLACDWHAFATALGKSSTEMACGVYHVGLPRSSLHVTLDGITLKPPLALGSWLAFAPKGDKTMVMGDLVLTEEEIEPVMKTLAESGIDITALHNHLLRAKASDLLHACLCRARLA